MGYNDLMIDEQMLTGYRKWFTEYAATFRTGELEYDRNIIIKEDHTARVCQEITYIGQNIGLNRHDLLLAETMALFHDVGRFEQYVKFGTFADHLSVNHAEFGVEIMNDKQVLDSLDPEERKLILRAILYHNRRDLPIDETDACLRYAKMLRDADKLDIWQVFADYYRHGGEKENSVLIHNFPDTPGISPEIHAELVAARIANYSDVKNLNDFKLLQVGWVYDINFPPTFRRVHDRGYLDSIRSALPDSEQIDQVFFAAQAYLNDKL